MGKIARVFFAYPSAPPDLRATIEAGAQNASNRASALDVRTWPATSIVGEHIADSVRTEIGLANFLAADITVKNPNVYYEIGYAIGKGLPILPTINRSHADAIRQVQSEGYFDGIKFETYENKDALGSVITEFHGTSLLDVYGRDLNTAQPLYILDTQIKTDFRNAIVSAVKEAKVFFRAFDPVETPRFSTIRVIGEATSSVGAVIPLLAPHIEDAGRHNLRASFLAGLMHGLGRPTLLVQDSDGPVPLDYRESVVTEANVLLVPQLVKDFASDAVKQLQTLVRGKKRNQPTRTPIKDLWLGASAAENEFRNLDQYFLETAEYIRTVKGDGKIVVGRKGAGKTAIFFMARDHFRSQRTNVVVDLKPESHELIELRELLMKFSSLGVASHTFAGFWYVLLLIEIALKLADDLRVRVGRDASALRSSDALQKALEKFGIPSRADFTARLKMFIDRISAEIRRTIDREGNLSVEKLTNFVFGEDQKALRETIAQVAKARGKVVVLFDNLDKGWPAAGVTTDDSIFVRSLIDSLNRIQRDFSTLDVEFQFSVFIRNDVYELLIDGTSDRGKEAVIPLDWTDREKLKVVIAKRIAAHADRRNGEAAKWDTYFPEKVDERDSLDYAIDHCLMRPRFLIDIVERSISFAINRQHSTVSANDMRDAVRQHSYSLVDDFGFEIRDATGLTNQIIDIFLGCNRELPEQEVIERVGSVANDEVTPQKIVELLLWYGFLGIRVERGERYIYDFNYSMRRLKAEALRLGGPLIYIVNRAFFVGLDT